MVRAMDSVRRACVRLGTVALLSVVLSLLVMLFVIETRQVARWFVASAALAGAAYVTAAVAAYLDR